MTKKPSLNLYTLVRDLPEKKVSETGREYLIASGFNAMLDFDDKDVADILMGVRQHGLPRDALDLFGLLVRSGVNFKLSPSSLISSLGMLSGVASARLAKHGILRLSDLEERYFPEIYELIGYGQGKVLLVAAVTSGVSVRFQSPQWSEAEWKQFLEKIVELGIVQWEDVAIATLAELNPPQVGTQVNLAVQHLYDKGKAMREVMKWFYSQAGKCEVSGKRLFLEVDHKVPKEHFIKANKDVKKADNLENFQLLTKRQNVIKRGSHRLGGISFANASAVLMFVLLHHRPKSIKDFAKLCRSYGLTMSPIRFDEAWAMAHWLARDGLYELAQSNTEILTDLVDGESEDIDEEADDELGAS